MVKSDVLFLVALHLYFVLQPQVACSCMNFQLDCVAVAFT